MSKATQPAGHHGQAQATTTTKTTTQTERNVRKIQSHPKSGLEWVSHAIFGDPDYKWGYFQPYVRDAKKTGRWTEWSVSALANADDGAPLKEKDDDSRSKRRTKYKMAEELKNDTRPARVDIRGILGVDYHPGDYNDDFFRLHYSNLYTKTVNFVYKWFDGGVNIRSTGGDPKNDPNYHSGMWNMALSEQFLQYARFVAHEDMGADKWQGMIDRGQSRKWLIVGILGQIMERKIFNELLFGADRFTAAELERLDFKWVNKEGYGRKASRAITARYSVENTLVPPNFWYRVDELTAGTTEIFLPMLNVFKEYWSDSTKGPDYNLQFFMQELHALFSYAGLLQVCMAISPSIFHFVSATPGSRMDYSLEQQSDMQLYRESRDRYERLDKQWAVEMDSAAPGTRVNVPGEGEMQAPENKEARRKMEYHRIRGARVKFAVFPKVTRYRPENKGKGQPDLRNIKDGSQFQDLMADVEGQSIVDISHCMVVYYQGLMYPEPNKIEATTLDQHLDSIVKPSNGLFALIYFLLEKVFKYLRIGFWHVLVVGVLIGLVYSSYAGSGFIAYLGRAWIVPLLAFSFCFYLISNYYFRDVRDPVKGWLTILLPLLSLYAAGFYYTYNQIEPPAHSPENDWWPILYISDSIFSFLRQVLAIIGIGAGPAKASA
ncbi:hypothetical protein GGR54DRAFT_102657 [Hypoxylon sp. NC1633]|nr:hypothetical protein GGR54DRAFT_102657 [Hypoxylon sp. NC1633]